MQIFVRTLTGRSITLDVAPTDSILELKSSIQRRQNFSADIDIRLTFGGTSSSKIQPLVPLRCCRKLGCCYKRRRSIASEPLYVRRQAAY